jgi:hypothetical protein
MEAQNVTYPDIPAGEFATGERPFTVEILGGAPDGHLAEFTLTVTDGNQVWDLVFSLPLQAPALGVTGSEVDDALGGDDSRTADAGETFLLELAVVNLGSSDAAAIAATLACEHPDVTVTGPSGSCPAVPAGGEGQLGVFEVTIASSYPEPHPLVFDLAVIAGSGYSESLQFELHVGGWFDDVETARGWTVGAPGDDAASGLWIAADPVGTSYNGLAVQPEDDHTTDPGTICFVTGNANPGDAAGTNDVDGGRTTLLSPVFDLADAISAQVSYWRWYTNDAGNSPDEDYWVVEVTNDGSDWITLENTNQSSAAWQQMSFDLGAMMQLTSTVQLRFIASDENDGSLVEAAVDDFLLDASFGTALAVEDAALAPAVLNLGENYPNPFNPATRITFSLPRSGEVDLAVFDLAGRRVATLVRGTVEAGRHEVMWRGRDDRGGAVASGVYFSRLVAGGELLTRKMMLLK